MEMQAEGIGEIIEIVQIKIAGETDRRQRTRPREKRQSFSLARNGKSPACQTIHESLRCAYPSAEAGMEPRSDGVKIGLDFKTTAMGPKHQQRTRPRARTRPQEPEHQQRSRPRARRAPRPKWMPQELGEGGLSRSRSSNNDRYLGLEGDRRTALPRLPVRYPSN